MRRTSFGLLLVAFLAFSHFILGTQDPTDVAEAHNNRGVAFMEQFNFKNAAAEFEALVALRPDSAKALNNLATAYFNQRDFDRALETLLEAKRLDPESLQVQYNLGMIYKLQGKSADAVTAFEFVAVRDPVDPMTHYYLGTVYANLGDLDVAASHLRRAIELQPENEAAHFGLGNILIRQGNVEEGRRELEAFRHLKESFPTSSAGLQYTEMGRYAEAIETFSDPLQPITPETIEEPVMRWADISADAGVEIPPLPAPAGLPDSIAAGELGTSFIEERWLPHWGSAVAFRDLDLDGDPDLLMLRSGAPVVLLNKDGSFERADETGLPVDGRFVGLTIGDVDNDLDPDIYLAGVGPNRLFLGDGTGLFTEAPDEAAAGASDNDVSVGATFADVDHDGDLDIYVSNYLAPDFDTAGREVLRIPFDLKGAPNRLYRNNGNGTFIDVAAESRTDGGAGRSMGALFSDFDEDRDIDFLVVNDGAPAQMFSNDRVGTYTEMAVSWGIEGSGRFRGADSTDFDQDGHFDLFLTAEGGLLNRLLRGPAASGFRPDVVSPHLLSAGVPGGRFGTAFADLDNDTDLDLIVVVNEADVLAVVYRNMPTGFERAGELRASASDSGEARSLSVADVDGDGRLDAALGTTRGRVLLFRNESENVGGWLRIAARGLRSNKDGFGTKIEIKAGQARQRRELRTSSGFLSQNDPSLHFGLGPHALADYIRFLWPGGVKQIEMDVAGGQTVTIEELNRKGTSCPILYAWDGRQVRFLTDFLGGSAVGNLLAPGHYNHPDTHEIIKVEQFDLKERDGLFDLRWVNQLEEVMMYDKAALVAVDHPDEMEIFPNERLMPAPPYPEPKLYGVGDLRTPLRALDDSGKDVTSLITDVDRRYPDGFDLLPFKGYAESHELTLDLGPIRTGEHVVLLLYGWVDYADSSSNLAASQAGIVCRPPYLDVEDGSGNFEPGLRQMGFPAGLPKTMLVDLDSLVGPGSSIVRITTNMRLYWDRIQVASVVPEAGLVVTELAADGAEFRFLGYPTPHRPDGRAPSLYDYSRVSDTELWDTHEGDYTRYGDVRELVHRVDDRYVIARHGDELALTFDTRRLPELPEGWKRSFLVVADGFGKDMDLNSARPDTVEPLPFHGMSAYPYPSTEQYPDSEEYRLYRETYNTRRYRANTRPATHQE